MAATIRDIRNKTGLSLATISKYLNGGNVRPQNKVLIEEAIEELNYEVNEIARGLVTKRTRIIGVIVYNVKNLFVGEVLHYIGQELRKKGYGMLICDSSDDAELEEQNLKFMINRKVDAILLFPVNPSGKFIKPARKAKIPMVLLDRSFIDQEVDSVGIDNQMAALRGTNVLIENNHKKIAVVSSKTEYTGMERLEGYRTAMKRAGLDILKEYVKADGSLSFEDGYKSTKELLALHERPTAIFFANYETTLGGIMALNEEDISWPQDVSIMGFDSMIVSRIVRPKLWLVLQPIKEMSEKAVELLIEKIGEEREGWPAKINLAVDIFKGESIRKLEDE